MQLMKIRMIRQSGLSKGNLLIIREVHEIVNRVRSWVTRTGIATNRAASRGEAFSRSIVDLVSCSIAATLVGVVEANPVSNIMG